MLGCEPGLTRRAFGAETVDTSRKEKDRFADLVMKKRHVRVVPQLSMNHDDQKKNTTAPVRRCVCWKMTDATRY